MASPFVRTMRSIETDPSRRTFLRLVAALVVLGAWGAWMTGSRVAVYATSQNGRLEVSRMVHRVAAQESGRIAAMHLDLGRVVAPGDLLAELDTTVEEKELAVKVADLAALAPRSEALRREIDAQKEARTWQGKVNVAALDRARIDLHAAQVTATHQEELSGISTRLHESELASTIDALNARSQATDSRIRAQGARVDVSKLAVSSRYDDRRSIAQIADLERQLAEVEGAVNGAEAAVEQSRAAIERRKVRAPVAGKLGSIDALQVGDVVSAGDVIAVIVPSDDVHVVAEFAPSDAVGRVLPGQGARVRMAGFSWTEFGMLDATVEQVASEPRNGTVRVELRLATVAERAIPVQHGLPGSVEVEIERVAPWVLVLRDVGAAIAAPAPAPVPAPAATPTPASSAPSTSVAGK